MHASKPPRDIPILVDLPVSTPGLGSEKYVAAIAGAIRGGTPAQFTIGLYGPWGKGKSSILKGIQAELKQDESIAVVPFDAWRYEKAPDLLVPLVWRMRQVLGDKKSPVQSMLTALRSVEIEFYGVTVKQGAQKADLTDGSLLSALESLSRLGSHLRPDQRIVVLVDDLDRCSPGRVMEVIESIRILMDVPGFVFVLAIDYDVLRRAIRERYKNVDADQFIEKIVQVPFRIPELVSADLSVVEAVLPQWQEIKSEWFPGFSDADMAEIARLALRNNPRQIKRVVNSAMLARHINWAASSPEQIKLLLASLAMQQRWLHEFEEMVAEIERWLLQEESDDNSTLGQVFASLSWAPSEGGTEVADPDEDLQAFLQRFLPRDSDLRAVIETLRLASEAAGVAQTVTSADTQVRRRRARSVNVIIEKGLIPAGAELAVDLRGCVRKPVRDQVGAWMKQDPRRARITWTAETPSPLAWDATPGQSWKPQDLLRKIFLDADAGPTSFSSANAFRYDGKTLAALASEVMQDAAEEE